MYNIIFWQKKVVFPSKWDADKGSCKIKAVISDVFCRWVKENTGILSSSCLQKKHSLEAFFLLD